MELISIIIPVYNAETTLQETLDSVFAQTWKNWEVVFFDDRSTDGSLEIINKTILKYTNTILVSNSSAINAGPAIGRNIAVQHSHGDVIAFLDSDDVWFNNYLEERIKVYHQFPGAGMVWGPSLRYYEEETLAQNTGLINEVRQYEKGFLIERFLLHTHGTPNPSATIMKKKVFLEIAGFDEELKRGEDISMALKVTMNYPVAYDFHLLFSYRKHVESSTSRSYRDGTFDLYNEEFIKWSIAFSKEHRLDPKLIEKLEQSHFSYLARKYEDASFIKRRSGLLKNLRKEQLLKKHLIDFMITAVFPLKFALKFIARFKH